MNAAKFKCSLKECFNDCTFRMVETCTAYGN